METITNFDRLHIKLKKIINQLDSTIVNSYGLRSFPSHLEEKILPDYEYIDSSNTIVESFHDIKINPNDENDPTIQLSMLTITETDEILFLNIYKNVINLKKIALDLSNDNTSLLIINLIKKYNQWSKNYLVRFNFPRNLQIGFIICVFAFIFGLFSHIPFFMISGVFSIIGIICYFIWYHYIPNNKTENDLFHDFFTFAREAEVRLRKKNI